MNLFQLTLIIHAYKFVFQKNSSYMFRPTAAVFKENVGTKKTFKRIMTQQIIIKCIYAQFRGINRLYPNPGLKHLPCNISSWKILTE